MTANPANYISSLTPLRGIAAILVVLYHYNVFLEIHAFPRLIALEHSRIIVNGYLWVDFFFILSGFVICHVYGDKLRKRKEGVVKKYLWARFTRLYPLHVFIMLLFAGQTAALFYYFPEYASENWGSAREFPDFLIHLFFLQTSGVIDHLAWNVPSWSIAAEWWTYLFAIGLIPLLGRSGFGVGLLSAAIALVGLAGIAYQDPGMSLDAIYGMGTLRCIFGFSIGVVVYRAYSNIANSNKETAFGKSWVFGLLSACALSVLHFDLFDVFAIPFFGGIILCAALNRGLVSRLLNSKPLVFLGDISYSIYLIHVLWLTTWWMWLDVYFIPNNPDVKPGFSRNVVWLSTLLVLIIGSSWLTYKYVEIAVRAKLRGWSRPSSKDSASLPAKNVT